MELLLELPVSLVELVPPLVLPALVDPVLVLLDDPAPVSPVEVLVVVEDVALVVGVAVVLDVVVGAVATVVVVPESLPNVPVEPPSV